MYNVVIIHVTKLLLFDKLYSHAYLFFYRYICDQGDEKEKEYSIKMMSSHSMNESVLMIRKKNMCVIIIIKIIVWYYSSFFVRNRTNVSLIDILSFFGKIFYLLPRLKIHNWYIDYDCIENNFRWSDFYTWQSVISDYFVETKRRISQVIRMFKSHIVFKGRSSLG